ncbi:MAG: hypothetical protein V8T62_02940 [Oscillospiraceae bacterium]
MRMGTCKGQLDSQHRLHSGDAVFVPCGTRHNVINSSNCPLKLSSIYAPSQHPQYTIHRTKEDAAKETHQVVRQGHLQETPDRQQDERQRRDSAFSTAIWLHEKPGRSPVLGD